ncbi:alpha/beta hydrolase [Thalassospira sp. TSL5-1]|uniref:alpha/beta hydrolase n=1 Tax=Thalassospira sp. TSL5-1 TaxID=1544451 RepID=UPI00095CDB60|nr:alpha/beta hydrolase [Thalassospira sp. TSL5-1]OKH86231.1 hypothetical protein LF95_23690 [Thalassospira sp. TSL5-1]
MKLIRSILVLGVMVILAGCSNVAARHEVRTRLAADAGWQAGVVKAGLFDIAAAWSPVQKGETLFVYLEGDGLAYVTAYRPAMDPTPTDPVALRMALQDIHLTGIAAQPVVYLARPCQYTMPEKGENCSRKYWTTARYAPEIIHSISLAIDQFKARFRARHLVLVGYSGGGALAVLLAAERQDVAGIVTVAGNLDLAYWAQRDGLTPLADSVDPARFAPQVADIAQLHFAGGQDDAVGPDVTRSYMAALPDRSKAEMVVMDQYDHHCCWARDWHEISRRPEFTRIPYWNGP